MEYRFIKKIKETQEVVWAKVCGKSTSPFGFSVTRFLLFFVLVTVLFSYTWIGSANAALIGFTRPANYIGLVGHWTFDGKDVVNGVAIDKSGNGKNGNLVSIATSTFYAPGKIGQGFNFDGVNDYVNIPDPNLIEGLSAMTVSAWARSDILLTSDTIAIVTQNFGSGGDPFALYLRNIDNIAFAVDTGAGLVLADANADIADTNWHHYVGVYNGSNLLLYVDNVLQTDQPAQTGNIITSTNPVTIGKYDSTSVSWNGLIDDVRIYNRALSVTEVKQLYTSTAGSKVAVTPKNTVGQGLSSGLVGHWTFDGKDTIGGTIRDISGQGNHGNVVNIATSTFYVPGKIGQGLNFDGVDDLINLGTNDTLLNETSPVTISAWVYPRSIGENAGGRIVARASSTNGPMLAITTSGVLRFEVDGSTDLVRTSASDTLILNKWQHVVATWDGSSTATNVHFYIDGLETSYVTSTNLVSPVDNSAQALFIGNVSAGSRTFNGTIDDVRIYNRALSVTEVKQLYTSTAGSKVAVTPKNTVGQGLSSGLVGHWTFDGKDTIGGTIRDISGQGNHGNVVNIATSTFYVPGKIGQGLNFDATNDVIDFGDIADAVPQLTVSVWVKNSTVLLASLDSIIAKDRSGFTQWIMSRSSTEKYAFQVCNDTPTCVTATADSASATTDWTHVVGSYDGAEVQVYVNSVAADSTPPALTGNVRDRVDHMCLSGSWNGSACVDAGVQAKIIDDVRVYNRALSATEITMLYNLGK